MTKGLFFNSLLRSFMRTNVVLDDELVNEALQHSGARTKREVIDLALRELVANRKKANLMELRGKVSFDPDYDYKTARSTT